MNLPPIKPLNDKSSDFLKVVLPACSRGHTAAVSEYLRVQPAFATRIGPHGRTMLWEAARRGRTGIVRMLVEDFHADPRAIGCYYRETRVEVSPWLIATLNRKPSAAAYLNSIDAGPTFLDALFIGNESLVKSTLKEKPTLVNRPAYRDDPWYAYRAFPLQYAIAGKQIEMVKLLLAHGANAAKYPRIIYDAIDTHQHKIARLLLVAGADPVASQHRDWLTKPRFTKMAEAMGHSIAADDFPSEKWPELVDACRGNHNAPDDVERVIPLLERGDDINTRDYKSKTALHRACQAGFLQIPQLLIDHGADLEAESELGETPLFDAAFYGRTQTLELLVNAGADVDARNAKGETTAFAAARGAAVETLSRLHELGVSLEIANRQGKTLIDYAQKSRKKGMAKIRDWIKRQSR